MNFRAPPSLILILEQLVSLSLVVPSSMTSLILMGLWRSPMKEQALTRVLVTVLQLQLQVEGTMSEKNFLRKTTFKFATGTRDSLTVLDSIITMLISTARMLDLLPVQMTLTPANWLVMTLETLDIRPWMCIQVTTVMVCQCMDSAGIHLVPCSHLATSSTLGLPHQQWSQYQGHTQWLALTQTTHSLLMQTVTWMRLMVWLFKKFLSNISSSSGANHPTTGQYSYFMTTGYPWTPIKFAGDQVIYN